VEGDAGRREAASDRCQLATLFLADQPIVPLFRRSSLVDVQHEVLPLLHVTEELLRGPDLQHGPDNILSFTRICPGGKAGA